MKKISFFIILALCCQHALARTLYVSGTGSDRNDGLSQASAFQSVEKAFLLLKDQDTIRIGEGTFTVSKTLEWGNKSICVIGSGADKTIVQASEEPIKDIQSVYTYSVFYNMKPVTCDNTPFESVISDLTIRNGAAPVSETMPTGVGGGIRNFATLTVKNCILENNVALNGGAIYNAGTLVLENSIVRNNHAFNVEGGVFNTGNATFTPKGDNTIEQNTADELFNTTVSICDFETGFPGRHGTNGNAEGGYVENSPMFTIVDNPDKSGLNTSDKVGKFRRLKTGNWWAYAWFEFPTCNIQVVPRYLHIMVRKNIVSRVCIQVKDRHENPVSNTGEILSDAQTKTNEWEDLVFEIPNTGSYCYIEVKADFVNQPPNSRLTDDIDIYFDDIIINGSPVPRTSAQETRTLGRFDFPTEEASLFPTCTDAQVNMSELSYTDNLTYDYNTGLGYFRPWGWPEGEKDPGRYLEFTLAPQQGYSVNIERISLVHKPNTIRLGPSAVEIMCSLDGGDTFRSLYNADFTDRGSFTTHTAQTDGLNTCDPVLFRLYAYESLHGSAKEKDFWIIDYIELSGQTSSCGTTGIHSDCNPAENPACHYAGGQLYITNVHEETLVTLFDLLGNRLLSQRIDTDIVLSLQRTDCILLCRFETNRKSRTIKLACH